MWWPEEGITTESTENTEREEWESEIDSRQGHQERWDGEDVRNSGTNPSNKSIEPQKVSIYTLEPLGIRHETTDSILWSTLADL